jgi:hypothetical protein
MNDEELQEVVDAWVAAQEAGGGTPEYERNWWAIEKVLGWATPENDPELLWRFIQAAYRRELAEHVSGMVAASALEDLLSVYGPDYIDRAEVLAREDARFKLLLRGVWRLGMTDDVWLRVQAARL